MSDRDDEVARIVEALLTSRLPAGSPDAGDRYWATLSDDEIASDLYDAGLRSTSRDEVREGEAMRDTPPPSGEDTEPDRDTANAGDTGRYDDLLLVIGGLKFTIDALRGAAAAVTAYAAEPPEYPGLVLVPKADLDTLRAAISPGRGGHTMNGDDKCADCRILRRYHDMPEAGRDHPFRSPVIECEADETKVLAQQLHDDIRSGAVSVADLAKVLTLMGKP